MNLIPYSGSLSPSNEVTPSNTIVDNDTCPDFHPNGSTFKHYRGKLRLLSSIHKDIMPTINLIRYHKFVAYDIDYIPDDATPLLNVKIQANAVPTSQE